MVRPFASNYFAQLSRIQSDCSIRVFRAYVCVLLEYFNGALYIKCMGFNFPNYSLI